MKKRDFLKLGLATAATLIIPRKLKALEYYPSKSEKKWAIIYGTWCGSSRDAAVWISEGMNGIANVFDSRETPDLSGYDYIVAGGSIRSGQTPPQFQEYINRNQKLLSEKCRGLFAVCGNMMQPVGPKQKTDLIDNHLAKLCGISDVPSRVFLGRITLGLLDPDSRKMMESMKMQDYDNLKRAECLALGKEIYESTLAKK